MKNLIAIVPAFLFLVLPSFAATFETTVALKNQDIMQITAEKYPGKTFYMGARMNEQNVVQTFYYDDQNGVRHDVTPDQARNGLTVIVMDGHEVVKLAIQYHPETLGGNASFSYLHNGATGEFLSTPMHLIFDASKNVYQVLDTNNRPIKKARVYTRTFLGVEIGIDHVDFS